MKIKVLKQFRLRKDRTIIKGISGLQAIGTIIDMPQERAENAINAGLATLEPTNKANESKSKAAVHTPKKRKNKGK